MLLTQKTRRNGNHQPDKAQKAKIADALCAAVGQICDAWDGAVEAHAARGYPTRSPGPRAAAATVRLDRNDPLHTRQQPPATAKASAFGDQTGDEALREDPSEKWLASARAHLLMLLSVSGAEVPGERRWTVPFHPPAIRSTMCRAAEDLVDMWPRNVGKFIDRVLGLGGTGVTLWPPTPRPGDTIETPDGPVTVGKRSRSVETCAECRGPIGATAADPVRRIDGKPYHASSCYYRVYRRARNGGAPAQQSA